MYRYFLGARYLFSRPIMWITVVAVTLGMGAFVVVDSIFNGFILESRRIARGTTSDLIVQPPRGVNYAELRRQILATRGVDGVARRLLIPCLYPTDKALPETIGLGQVSRGPIIQVQGIDAADEPTVSDLSAYLGNVPVERAVSDVARPFDLGPYATQIEATRRGTGEPVWPIVLGDRLITTLELTPGDQIELLTLPRDTDLEQELDLSDSSGQFLVVGSFKTGHLLNDLTTAYVPIEDLRQFTGVPEQAHEIAVKAQPDQDLEELALRLPLELYQLGVLPHSVLTWLDVKRRWIGAIENQRHILDVILFFIVFVAGFNLLVTLNMTITQKFRDIGILASMGGSSWGIASIFTSCGLLVSLLGCGIGILTGMLIAANVETVHGFLSGILGNPIWRDEVYGFEEIPSAIDYQRIGVCVVASVMITLLFALVASLRAARIDPVQALRRR